MSTLYLSFCGVSSFTDSNQNYFLLKHHRLPPNTFRRTIDRERGIRQIGGRENLSKRGFRIFLSKLSINRFECWYFAQSLKLKLKLLNKIEVCSKYFEGWSKFETKLYSSPEPLVDNFLVRLSEKNLSQFAFVGVKFWVQERELATNFDSQQKCGL